MGLRPALFSLVEMTTAQTRTVEALIAPTLESLGYDLVRVKMFGAARPTLQVMAERLDGGGMTVDDCAAISRAVSAILDVEDPIAGAYMLEVSSPGLDRPLVRPRDFQRFAGFEAKIELRHPVDGRKRFRGALVGYADGAVTIETEAGTAAVPFDDIDNAKLVITDELLAAGRAAATNQGRV